MFGSDTGSGSAGCADGGGTVGAAVVGGGRHEGGVALGTWHVATSQHATQQWFLGVDNARSFGIVRVETD